MSQPNSEYFQEFLRWLGRPSLSRESGFLATCYDDDIRPCISFKNRAVSLPTSCCHALDCSVDPDGHLQFADNILVAIEQDKLCMEAVAPQVSCPKLVNLMVSLPFSVWRGCLLPQLLHLVWSITQTMQIPSEIRREQYLALHQPESEGQSWLSVCCWLGIRHSCALFVLQVAAVCDFYSYLRYIIRGIVKADGTFVHWYIWSPWPQTIVGFSVHSMFRELIRRRAEMALSRLGLTTNWTMEGWTVMAISIYKNCSNVNNCWSEST